MLATILISMRIRNLIRESENILFVTEPLCNQNRNREIKSTACSVSLFSFALIIFSVSEM